MEDVDGLPDRLQLEAAPPERVAAEHSSTAEPSAEVPVAAMNNGPRTQYRCTNVVGHGSFGIVYRAVARRTNEVVAIKEVLQDRRYKNRELQIMRMFHNPNIVALREFFYTASHRSGGGRPHNGDGEVYLNLVLEYLPDTLSHVNRQYAKARKRMPLLLLKLYTYQMFRALWYIHIMHYCHRDVKPENLLVNTKTQVLKLCDFGSAKKLVPGEANISYICSRFYRAPELIFGATSYTTAVDVWSGGCVMAEMILGQPLFPGHSCVDQLVRILKVLGTPTHKEIEAMHKSADFSYPELPRQAWRALVQDFRCVEAMDLLDNILTYDPASRLTARQVLAHSFFDELRDPNTRLANGDKMPPLFDFSEAEMRDAGPLLPRLLPRKVESSRTSTDAE